MAAIKRPEYRVLLPGQQHFDCQSLRATLSTSDCARRWRQDDIGLSCADCAIGRLHHSDYAKAKAPTAPSKKDWSPCPDNACLRCGRSDLRVIQLHGLCVSCANRRIESIKGRNRKGTVPVKFQMPRFECESLVQLGNGTVERRTGLGLDAAEALWRLLRNLPAGASLVSERRLTVWDAATGQFVRVCQAGEQEVHRETVQQQVLALDVGAVASLLGACPDLVADGVFDWTPTSYACGKCRAGQIEGMLAVPQGQWRTRCRACGDNNIDEKEQPT